LGDLLGKLSLSYSRILSLLAGLTGTARRAASNPRLRGELFWVITHKVLEFLLSFVVLKVLTVFLGTKNYGEYALALVGMQMMSAILMMPMQQAYLRYIHTVQGAGAAGRAAGLTVLRWYTVASIAVIFCACALTATFSKWFGLGTLTVLAAGLLFVGNRWRLLGTQVLDIKRRRRACAFQNLGFLVSQIVAVVVAVRIWSPSASVALLATAAAAAVFGAISLTTFAHGIRSLPKGPPSDLMKLVKSYGAAAGALLLFQWMQNLVDRYFLAIQLDKEAVGLYSAGYQVCGVPYMFGFTFLYALLVPIVFQRAKDISRPGQLWSADKVLIGGIGVYVTVGALALLIYAAFGQQIMLLLTSKGFVLPSHTLVFLALTRYAQCLAMLLQVFFNIHNSMGAAFRFRAIGAAITLPISWFAIRWYGIGGAAVGGFAAACIYLALMSLSNGGCVRLVLRARRELHRQISES